MSLFDILACPTCKIHVLRQGDVLTCRQCGKNYPIVNGVPVMMPDASIPTVVHESELVVRTTYDQWVFRTILQSLLDNQLVLEIGSGNMALDDPCIIRMDVTLTPYVDLVADAHALPFLPGSLDYVFSLAVFEHLRNPFLAAQSIYEALKDGGLIYHECNFLFAYHGYPHHYFNASMQGMEQVFSAYRPLRTGVAPYQMPSFAVNNVLRSYMDHTQAHEYRHGRRLTALMEHIVKQDLMQFDIYFSEAEALRVAAGTYFSGVKQVTRESTLVPELIRDLWRQDTDLQRRFPDLNQLTTPNNILVWARGEGRQAYPELARYLEKLPVANKRDAGTGWSRAALRALPLAENLFGAVGYDPRIPMSANSRLAQKVPWVPGPSFISNLMDSPIRLARRVPLLRRLNSWLRQQWRPK